MLKIISIIFVGILTSFGLFPFTPSFLPYGNTKMIMAGFGLLLVLYQLSNSREQGIPKDFVKLVVFSALVSLAGFFSNVYNNTSDFTYTSYIVSMLVWLSSSNVVVSAIRQVHGKATVALVANYLIAVCAAQCILALAADLMPAVKNIIDGLLAENNSMENHQERLYGLGCQLDVAGSRFSAILVLIAYLCTNLFKTKEQYTLPLSLYLTAFAIVAVVGNMISRTTIIGCGLALSYWVYIGVSSRYQSAGSSNKIWRSILIYLALSIPFIVYFYHTNPAIHSNIRFAFEGFFSLVEKGTWDVSSNNILKNMIVFPDTLKTWIIGDGYFNNPIFEDYHYIGPGIGEYYMNTDIGYLRFIFYFGLIGTFFFCLYMWQVACICKQRAPQYGMLFICLVLINYAIWFKVATDIFVVFSFFLCIQQEEENGDISSIKEM